MVRTKGSPVNYPIPDPLDVNAKVAIKRAGVAVGVRYNVNFVQGEGATITVADNPSTDAVDVTIAAAGGSGTPASTVVAETSFGASSAVGTSTDYARADHTHGSPSLGSGSGQACAGNDARLTDARTMLPSIQTISGDTTLTTQRDLLDVTAACAITLPAISSWSLGRPTRVVYRGTAAATIVVAANAADKIEGTTRVGLYGTDVEAVITPVAANRLVVRTVRGVAAWQHVALDLTAASGGSPWSIGGTTWTDISSASSSVAASSGLEFTAAASSSFTGAASATGAYARSPLSGLVDGWSRPLAIEDDFWLLTKSSKTTTVGGSSPNLLTVLGGAALSGVPRMGSSNNPTAGNLQYTGRDSAARTVDITSAASITASGWLGVEWSGRQRRLVDAMLSTSPSGTPGAASGWWPWAYAHTERYAVGQDFWGTIWALSSMTDVLIGQTNATTGSKITATEFVVLRVQRGT